MGTNGIQFLGRFVDDVFVDFVEEFTVVQGHQSVTEIRDTIEEIEN